MITEIYLAPDAIKPEYLDDYEQWDDRVAVAVITYLPRIEGRKYRANGDPGYESEGGCVDEVQILHRDTDGTDGTDITDWIEPAVIEKLKQFKEKSKP